MAGNVPYDVPRRQELAIHDFQGIDAALGKGHRYVSSQRASPKEDSIASSENLCVGSSPEPERPLVIRFGHECCCFHFVSYSLASHDKQVGAPSPLPREEDDVHTAHLLWAASLTAS